MCSLAKKFDAYGSEKGSGRSPSAHFDGINNGCSEIARNLDASTGMLIFVLISSHIS